jgi:hypothetical protein
VKEWRGITKSEQVNGLLLERLVGRHSLYFAPTFPEFLKNFPKCDSEMILRTAKSGANQGQQCWGCSNFPRGRAMLQLDAVAV